VNAAASQAGRTYCWAGGNESGPTHGDGDWNGEAPDCTASSTVGFDCTGLTQYAAYQGAGGAIDLTHHDSQQAQYAPGQWITSESALLPGDIVYFGSSRDDISHAGVYAGVVNGYQMIWDADTAFWVYPDGVHERRLDAYTNFVGAARVWSAASAPSNSYEAAFQANTNSLWSVGKDPHGDWQQGMMPGTSPSITTLAGGGYEIAFQANTGELITIGTAGGTNWHLGMMRATSPSIVGLPNGGFEVAFQANTGSLWTVGTDNHGAWGLGMMAGTSPAITAVPGGIGYEVAFQANTGSLWTVGTDNHGAWGLGMS
jgi:hypothetical protein